MKKLSLILFFMLVLSVSVYSADLSLVLSSVSPTPVNPGSTLSINVNLTNTEAGTISPISITTTDGTSGTTTLSLTDTLVTGESLTDFQLKPLVLSLPIPSSAEAGIYTATLTAFETDTTETDSVSYTFTVASSPSVEIELNNIVISDPLSIDLQSGEDDNLMTLTVTNNGNVDLTNLELSADFDNLEDDDGDLIAVTNPAAVGDLDVGDEVTVTFNFDVESGFDLSNLNGFLVVESDQFDDQQNFVLNVKPLACLPNSRSGDLDVEVDTPEDNDEFEPGDLVDLRMTIENNGEDDIDTKVSAVIYNRDSDRKEDSQTLTRNIDSDDSEDVNMDLELGDVDDEDDQFTLFLKVFDDDDEEGSCSLEEIDLDVEIPEHKVNIEDISFSPSSAACGQEVRGSALIRNVGDNDESVTLEVYNLVLGLSETSPSFILEDVGTNENDQSINFVFTVPDDVNAGNYPLYFKTRYNGEETIALEYLTITECNLVSSPTLTAVSQAPLQQTAQAPVTSAVTYEQKDLFDVFNSPSSKVPAYVWVLLDVLLVILIIGALVWIFRPR